MWNVAMARKKKTTVPSVKEWDTSAESADTQTATAPVTTGRTSSRARSAATNETTAQVGPHDHLCTRCNYEWGCLQAKCHVEHAAKVNKGGPFCHLCMHIIMAKRFAILRELSFPAFLAMLGDLTDVE